MQDGHFNSKNTSCFKNKKDTATLKKTPKNLRKNILTSKINL